MGQLGFSRKKRGELSRRVIEKVFDQAVEVLGKVAFLTHQWEIFPEFSSRFVAHKVFILHTGQQRGNRRGRRLGV